ncbi:hypothetical protein [Amycolatopsis nigrescens]|uniref:hypothetical protein n=1 Tax=Amycolatopsis nigrescens TaxID=381445 RepID=UPI00036705F5|nr:hypothetical protein [Amycolatopsis nigrescens]
MPESSGFPQRGLFGGRVVQATSDGPVPGAAASPPHDAMITEKSELELHAFVRATRSLRAAGIRPLWTFAPLLTLS